MDEYKSFRKSVIAEFEPSQRDRALYEAAAEYHTLTDQWDQAHFQRSNGMPLTGAERSASTRHAMLVMSALLSELEPHGVTASELRLAIQKFLR